MKHERGSMQWNKVLLIVTIWLNVYVSGYFDGIGYGRWGLIPGCIGIVLLGCCYFKITNCSQ